MRRIVSASLRFRFLVIAIAVGMIFFGAAQLRQVPVDVFPEFAPPRVEIQTPALGMTAAEVESLVTVPLEQALSGVQGLDILRSKSAPQVSAIELIFRSDVDLLHARQLVAERMSSVTATLPTWAGPPIMMPPVSATSRVMKIGLSSSSVSLIDMSMTAYWKIRTRLLNVPGVANVAIWGERLKMLQVQAEPDAAGPVRRLAPAGHGRHVGGARRRDPPVLVRGRDRHRRVRSTPRTSGWPSSTSRRSSSRRTCPTSRSSGGWAIRWP